MRISDWSSDVCSSDLESPCSCVCPRFDPYRVAQTLHGFSHRRVIVDDVHDRILVRLGLHPTSSPPSWHKSACASIESILRRSEEHTSELQSLMRISYAVFCLKKKNNNLTNANTHVLPHMQ